MSHVTKNALKNTLKKTINAGANRKASIESAYTDLVDSLYQVEVAHANTVSGSGVVNLSVTQPANSFIEDVIIICTANAAFSTSGLGARVGTSAGDGTILNSFVCLEPNSSTGINAGVGTSIHDKIRLSLAGNATISLSAGEVYTATKRTIHTQVSASVDTFGFTNDNGEFTVAVKYVQL